MTRYSSTIVWMWKTWNSWWKRWDGWLMVVYFVGGQKFYQRWDEWLDEDDRGRVRLQITLCVSHHSYGVCLSSVIIWRPIIVKVQSTIIMSSSSWIGETLRLSLGHKKEERTWKHREPVPSTVLGYPKRFVIPVVSIPQHISQAIDIGCIIDRSARKDTFAQLIFGESSRFLFFSLSHRTIALSVLWLRDIQSVAWLE